MSPSFRVEAALRSALIAKAALESIGERISPKLVVLTMQDVIVQAQNLIDLAERETNK